MSENEKKFNFNFNFNFINNMNLPNKLTMLRVLMIPFFVFFMILSCKPGQIDEARALMTGGFKALRIIACVIFCVASLTDFLDGYIARRDNLVTNFGKFMDPIADKLLVCSALILLAVEGSLPSWIVLIIIAREFIISGFRLVAAESGTVIAASYWGKFKTNAQMFLCIDLILPGLSLKLGPVTLILTILATALTIISLVDYMYKNISVITKGGM